MPDFIMLIHYPFSKPINAKGYMTRTYMLSDVVHLYEIPQITHIATEQVLATHLRGELQPAPGLSEETRAITPPTVTRIVEETPGVEVTVT
jgi:hypothetical protein